MWAARISRNSFADDGRGSRALRAVARARTLEDVEVGRGAPRRAIAMSVVTRLDPWPSEDELTTLRADVVAFARSEGAGEVDPGDVRVVAAPYRVCPLGAHIDHQGGRVAGFALNCGVALAFLPTPTPLPPTAVRVRTDAFAGVVRFDTRDVPPAKGVAGEACEWGAFPRGAAHVYRCDRAARRTELGADADVDRDFDPSFPGFVGCLRAYPSGLDRGGVSSSAAVSLALLSAFRVVDEGDDAWNASAWDLVRAGRALENEHVGVRSGLLDQASVACSAPGSLTLVDCAREEVTRVPFAANRDPSANGVRETSDPASPSLPPFVVLLAFSGLRESLASTGYNLRVEECAAAAEALRPGSETLREVPRETFERARAESHLNPTSRRRAEHFFSESSRVDEGERAWREGNLDRFGALMRASGESSVVNYECGCEPMCELRDIVARAPGVYGVRFSGAGFRGCCAALCAAEDVEAAAAEIRVAYASARPKLAPRAHVVVTKMGEGFRLFDATGGTRTQAREDARAREAMRE